MADTIGFIGGGQMAEAMIRGIIESGLYDATAILVAEPNGDRCDYMSRTYGVKGFGDSVSLWQECNTIVLAVKPQVMHIVLDGGKELVTPGHLIISIAAGLPISFYEEGFGRDDCKIIRVMPNTPALVLEAASGFAGNKNVTPEELTRCEEILNNIGTAVAMDETALDAVTGLSGSGPAYVFTFIDAMIDAGIKAGLPRPTAETLALQTVLGSVKLLMESGKHPAELRGMVTSPGGTTIAAQHVLERSGFKGILMDAIEAAVNRSRELGKK
ncbi:MAG: pyrroline-5-carboxylate reductase [Thermodesulfobacteriota bacterium]